MADKNYALVSPSGDKYETTSRVEATRLKARGYTEQAPKSASKPTTTTSSASSSTSESK